MAKRGEGLAEARREEIVDACAGLYARRPFREISVRDIAADTSFTRASVYNYFESKEEIFLALLQREYGAWLGSLEELYAACGGLSARGFAAGLAATLEARGCMLKLLSMNLYDLELNSRLENLAEFKRRYAAAREALGRCLERAFPQMGRAGAQEFERAFFPFLFGVYPFTSHSEKQLAAMALAGVEYERLGIRELVETFAAQLLRPYARPGEDI